MPDDTTQDDELAAAIASLTGRWENLDGDAWDVYLTPAGGLVARSVFDGTEKSAFGVIGMGPWVGALPEGFVGEDDGQLRLGV